MPAARKNKSAAERLTVTARRLIHSGVAVLGPLKDDQAKYVLLSPNVPSVPLGNSVRAATEELKRLAPRASTTPLTELPRPPRPRIDVVGHLRGLAADPKSNFALFRARMRNRFLARLAEEREKAEADARADARHTRKARKAREEATRERRERERRDKLCREGYGQRPTLALTRGEGD